MLTLWLGDSSQSKMTSPASCSSHAACRVSSFPRPISEPGHGLARRCVSVAATSAPAVQASRRISSSESSISLAASAGRIRPTRMAVSITGGRSSSINRSFLPSVIPSSFVFSNLLYYYITGMRLNLLVQASSLCTRSKSWPTLKQQRKDRKHRDKALRLSSICMDPAGAGPVRRGRLCRGCIGRKCARTRTAEGDIPFARNTL